ncbi:MAG: hypothetical protein ACI9BV_003788 [Rhodothermales bacterium]|jgi:hypothetical protein
MVSSGELVLPANNLVVIIGSPRSGTTFAMRVLQSLPNVAAVSGVVYPATIPQYIDRLPPEERGLLVSELRQSLTRYLRSALHTSRAVGLQKWWRSGRTPGRLMQALGRQPVWDTVVYKEPFLSFSPGMIEEALPGVRIVHMIRDGRDCADSLVRTYGVLSDEQLASRDGVEVAVSRVWQGRRIPDWLPAGDEKQFLEASPFVRSVFMWREMVQKCRSASDSATADGRPFLEVRYEDLMSDPGRTFDRMAQFMRVELNGRARKVLRSAHTQSIGNHARQSEEDRDRAWRVAGELLESYGYVR